MDYLVSEDKLPVSLACGCVGLTRASYCRKQLDRSVKDALVVDLLNRIVAKHGRWGLGLCFSWMRNNGYLWNHKRVWPVYKLPTLLLIAPTEENIDWALNFMHDTLLFSKPFRTLNIIDESRRSP